jgi:hypothetical protein
VLSSRPALPKEAEAFPGAETDETSDNNIIKSETI